MKKTVKPTAPLKKLKLTREVVTNLTKEQQQRVAGGSGTSTCCSDGTFYACSGNQGYNC